MESSLKLADMGYKVALVEKEASVGGRMILLSKVFPTLDCASCISGPKMTSTVHHDNITPMTYSEVVGIRRGPDGRFHATLRQKATYVDPSLCTGCNDCQTACSVAVPDQFNADLVPRRAAYIAFPQAVPKKAVIERAGTSPCTDTCPAGIKAHGYVSLIRSGQYEEAFQLVLDATPLVGTLGGRATRRARPTAPVVTWRDRSQYAVSSASSPIGTMGRRMAPVSLRRHSTASTSRLSAPGPPG